VEINSIAASGTNGKVCLLLSFVYVKAVKPGSVALSTNDWAGKVATKNILSGNEVVLATGLESISPLHASRSGPAFSGRASRPFHPCSDKASGFEPPPTAKNGCLGEPQRLSSRIHLPRTIKPPVQTGSIANWK